jgi:AmmeMemoRadiSam system protein B
MRIRKAVVAGQFYPGSADGLEEMFSHFNATLEKALSDSALLQTKTRAVVAPHAGYIYSGFTANVAYRLLARSGAATVVVIGPSHRVGFAGASVGDFEAYETPLGDLAADMGLADTIRHRYGFGFLPQAHAEHSTETQFPFIRRYLPNARMVEVVYGQESPATIAQMVAWLLARPDTAVVISTDLSHFYTLEEAKKRDAVCLHAINRLDPQLLHRGCEACGIIGLEGMIEAASELELKPLILDYRTSADASGDIERVVGYVSAAFV